MSVVESILTKTLAETAKSLPVKAKPPKELAMFPAFVLSKLYVKGSLKNTETGFQFDLKNVVDSGTLVEIGPITVDGNPYEAASITVVTNSQELAGDQVMRTNPLPVHLGMLFT
jgi:hypothetical protein